MKRAAPLLAMLAFSACVAPETGTPPQTGASVGTVAKRAADPQPVTAARGIALFDAICGATLDGHFAMAKSAAAKVGVRAPSPLGTATIYGTSEDVSFQIKDGPGFGKTCSFIFATTEPLEVVQTAITKNIGPMMQTPLGVATLYRGQRAMVLISPGKRQGATTYHNLRLLSDR